MATIIDFNIGRLRGRVIRGRPEMMQPGEIVLFTGVRYERCLDEAGLGRATRQRQRDRIDLGE